MISASAKRIASSSSTKSTFVTRPRCPSASSRQAQSSAAQTGGTGRHVARRKPDRNGHAAALATGNAKPAAMRVDDLAAEREPHAATIRLGGERGHHRVLERFVRHAGAAIVDGGAIAT